jgi:hypothetical protein
MPFNLDAPELGAVSNRLQVHFLKEEHPEAYAKYIAEGGQPLTELYRASSVSHTEFLRMAEFVMRETGVTPADFLHIGSYIAKDEQDRAAKGAKLLQSPYRIFDQSETEMNPKLNVDSRILIGHLALDEETQAGQSRVLHYNLGQASLRYLLAPLTSVGYYHGVGVVCGTEISSHIRMLDQKAENIFRELGISYERRGHEFYLAGTEELLATRVAHNELERLNYLEIDHPLFRVLETIKLPNLTIPEGEIIQGNPNRFMGQRLPMKALQALKKRDLSFVALARDLAPYGDQSLYALREGTVLGLDTPAFASVYDFTWTEPSAANVWWRKKLGQFLSFVSGSKGQSLDVVSEGFRESEERRLESDNKRLEAEQETILERERRSSLELIVSGQRNELADKTRSEQEAMEREKQAIATADQTRELAGGELHHVSHHFNFLRAGSYGGVVKVLSFPLSYLGELALGKLFEGFEDKGVTDYPSFSAAYSSGALKPADVNAVVSRLDPILQRKAGIIPDQVISDFNSYLDWWESFKVEFDTQSKAARDAMKTIREDTLEEVLVRPIWDEALASQRPELLANINLNVNIDPEAGLTFYRRRVAILMENLLFNAIEEANKSYIPGGNKPLLSFTALPSNGGDLEMIMEQPTSWESEQTMLEITHSMSHAEGRFSTKGPENGGGLAFIKATLNLLEGTYEASGDYSSGTCRQRLFIPGKSAKEEAEDVDLEAAFNFGDW